MSSQVNPTCDRALSHRLKSSAVAELVQSRSNMIIERHLIFHSFQYVDGTNSPYELIYLSPLFPLSTWWRGG
jgi:hypothetical protein